MSDDQQPRAEWIFPDQPKKRAGAVWLIIGLVVVALIIIGTVLFLVFPSDETPNVSATPLAPSSTTPTTGPLDTETEEPSAPVTTPPSLPDPDIETFSGQVRPWLDDGVTGLEMVANANRPDATQVVDSLQGDADRLSGVVAPSAISSEWYDGVRTYASNLSDLRAAIDSGDATRNALDEARVSLESLRELVGM